jgi:hypothetical protein
MHGKVTTQHCLLMVILSPLPSQKQKAIIIFFKLKTGQTGSGKSYSVVGYGTNKGIVPLFCEEVFNKISTEKQEGVQYEVCANF